MLKLYPIGGYSLSFSSVALDQRVLFLKRLTWSPRSRPPTRANRYRRGYRSHQAGFRSPGIDPWYWLLDMRASESEASKRVGERPDVLEESGPWGLAGDFGGKRVQNSLGERRCLYLLEGEGS